MERLLSQLEKKEADYFKLAQAHDQSMHEMDEKSRRQQAMEDSVKQMQQQMKEFSRELETKNELVFIFRSSSHSD